MLFKFLDWFLSRQNMQLPVAHFKKIVVSSVLSVIQQEPYVDRV
jgi:hypothetical protein